MNKLSISLLSLALGACASTGGNKSFETPAPYIPKHPDLQLPQPTFTPVSLKDSEIAAKSIEIALGEASKHPNLVAFVEIAGSMLINAHRNDIMACSDANGWRAGPGLADPACVWPRPAADNWVGCMAMQFDPADFTRFNLSSVGEDSVFIWIDKHYDEIVKQPGGEDFLIKLNGIPFLGPNCENAVTPAPKAKGTLDV